MRREVEILKAIFKSNFQLNENLIFLKDITQNLTYKKEEQTQRVFNYKWRYMNNKVDVEKFYDFQKKWYLKLYGFETEEKLSTFLKSKEVILDVGCGLGYKSAWFANLSPESIVVGVDYSDSIYIAAEKYKTLRNLFFIRENISNIKIKENAIDYINCDQVLMHTEDPENTFLILSNLLKLNGELACYVYRKKALPRELLDNYFRLKAKDLSEEKLMEMSRQLTELGRMLANLNIKLNFPNIPVLGIKGGEQDLQRFIYWNFIKCFWNEELGYEMSVATNFDWYSPSNAKRYSKDEFEKIIKSNDLKIVYFHEEEACYSGRFKKEKK